MKPYDRGRRTEDRRRAALSVTTRQHEWVMLDAAAFRKFSRTLGAGD
jgi:hypothetical protein